MSSHYYYKDPTEDPEGLRTLLIENQINPRSILSVIGGYPWPVFFRRMYPKAIITSFDNNPEQINYSYAPVFESTKKEPKLVDVTDAKLFNDLVKSSQPDLAYLSNIPNFLFPYKPSEVATTLAKYKVPNILISSLEKMDKEFNTFNINGTSEFLRTLSSGNYQLQQLRLEESYYQIKTFHLAMLEV